MPTRTEGKPGAEHSLEIIDHEAVVSYENKIKKYAELSGRITDRTK